MKRNGLTVTAEELEGLAIDLKADVKDPKQKCEVPIINPSDCADGWILEYPAQ